MILLGIILLVVGWFLFRPLAWVGAVLLLIGVILWLTATPAFYGPNWY